MCGDDGALASPCRGIPYDTRSTNVVICPVLLFGMPKLGDKHSRRDDLRYLCTCIRVASFGATGRGHFLGSQLLQFELKSVQASKAFTTIY